MGKETARGMTPRLSATSTGVSRSFTMFGQSPSETRTWWGISSPPRRQVFPEKGRGVRGGGIVQRLYQVYLYEQWATTSKSNPRFHPRMLLDQHQLSGGSARRSGRLVQGTLAQAGEGQTTPGFATPSEKSNFRGGNPFGGHCNNHCRQLGRLIRHL